MAQNLYWQRRGLTLGLGRTPQHFISDENIKRITQKTIAVLDIP